MGSTNSKREGPRCSGNQIKVKLKLNNLKGSVSNIRNSLIHDLLGSKELGQSHISGFAISKSRSLSCRSCSTPYLPLTALSGHSTVQASAIFCVLTATEASSSSIALCAKDYVRMCLYFLKGLELLRRGFLLGTGTIERLPLGQDLTPCANFSIGFCCCSCCDKIV